MSFSQPTLTLIQALGRVLAEGGDRIAQCTPARGSLAEKAVTCRQLWQRAARFSSGLHQLGLQSGDNVVFLSENHADWLTVDLALQGLGCAMVPRGTSAPMHEVDFIIGKVRAPMVIIEQAAMLAHLPAAPPSLRWVVVLSGTVDRHVDGVEIVTRDQLFAAATNEATDWFEAQVEQRTPEDTASIVFTSGTTGQPKGVILSQFNLASNLAQVMEVIDFLRGGSRYVSILPTWHMFERIVEYALLSLGLTIIYSDRRHFTNDLKNYQSNVVAAVPRVWVLLMDGVLKKLSSLPRRQRWPIQALLGLSRRFVQVERLCRGRIPVYGRKSPAAWLKQLGAFLPCSVLLPVVFLARKTVFARIIEAIGIGGVRQGAAISGGGSLPDHVDLFFESLGICMLNGYGLTETSPVLSFRTPTSNMAGTVGRPVPNTQLKIVEPETGQPVRPGQAGIIHVRGPQVMEGYFDEVDATEHVLDEEGWFNTGDLGREAVDGSFAVTGRAKDTIVLLSGENIDPEPLENALAESSAIEQAVIVGQDQKYLGALIVPNRDFGADVHAVHDGHSVYDLLRREIDDKINPRRGFRPHERIVRFHVLDRSFSVEDGSLSQTLKIKRNVVFERHSTTIQTLFEDK